MTARRKRSDRRRGSVLIAVLFLAALLGIFAAAAASVMSAAADASRSFADTVRGDEAMRAAIEYIMARSGSAIQNARGTAVVGVGRANVTVTVRDETARIDINTAAPELIAGIFQQVGVGADAAKMYAARIVDWRDSDDKVSPNGGAERSAYRSAGRTDGPRNGKFRHVAELALVLGIPQRTAAAVAPYVTVASGREGVNPMIADPPVLRALPGMTAERLLDVLDQRKRGATYQSLISRLGPVQDFVTDEAPLAVRFEGRVQLSRGSERRYEVVVSVADGDTGRPYRILAWDANPPERTRSIQ
jgi:general secretion pathway protein K